jgi:hypothetical protein
MLGLDISPVFQKQLHTVYVSSVCLRVKGCPLAVGPSFDVQTILDQVFHKLAASEG